MRLRQSVARPERPMDREFLDSLHTLEIAEPAERDT
jgi:hypothetical protein